MAARTETDVLIVGAGPTGLALACQLRQLGIALRLIDKNPHASTTSKALGLQYRVSEVLACMGIADRFLARGHSWQFGVSFHLRGRQVLHLRMDALGRHIGKDAFVPRLIVIPQSETEAILADVLRERSGRVERSTTFLDFTQDADRVVSRLQLPDGGEEVVASKYLVSCEGAHSVIRKQGGFTFIGKTYPMRFIMADVDLDWAAARDTVHVWFHPDGMFTTIPMRGERQWRLFVEAGATDHQDAGAAPPTEVTLDLMQRLLAERTGDQATRASNPTWLTEFRINCRMVDHFRRGRVFLAGDAAHIHSPSGGQGITTGVQDAYNLAWKLGLVLKASAPDALLDTYEEERLPVARAVLATTDRNTRLLMAQGTLAQGLRNYVVLPLLRLRPVRDRMVNRLSQLDMNYCKASLSCHQDARWLGSGAKVRAGDRTPDVVFQNAASGERTSLFQCLGKFSLLALAGQDRVDAEASGRLVRLFGALGRLRVECFRVGPSTATPPAEGRWLVDVHGDFQRIYGVKGDFLYLIRPDGHVGLYQRPIDERNLRDYLRKLFRADVVAAAFP
jgi:2-polyprenyl-6-methoxyphenol hydroxylase-like FAD-dependent oxidoreductase